MILHYDLENGNDYWGGSSYTPLASGTDGTHNGTFNFHSDSAIFTPEMVGHMIAFTSSWYTVGKWVRILGFVDAHNITIEGMYAYPGYAGDPWPSHADMTFYVGGRWKDGKIPYGDGSVYCFPGDEHRYMASPPPYYLTDATWDNNVSYIDLASPVAMDIDQSTTSWTAANSATVSPVYTTRPYRIGGNAAGFKLPGTTLINKKYWYRTLAGSTDFSAYTRVNFFIYEGVVTKGPLKLCFCSDTLGDTVIGFVTIPLWVRNTPYIGHAWRSVLLDYGGPLPSNVQSIAIYSGDVAPDNGAQFVLTNLIAVKPEGDPLEFTFSHLVGKEHNRFWAPGETYALGKIRKPTPQNRNGFRYKVTVPGTSGAEEPAWPLDEGETVQDGSVTWLCEGPEDSWYPVRGLTGGTRLYFDYGCYFRPALTEQKLATDNETVGLYARKPIPRLPFNSSDAAGYSNWSWNGWEDSPDYYDPIGPRYSGGWSRTDMATMEDETWTDNVLYSGSTLRGTQYATYDNLNGVRAKYGIDTPSPGVLYENCHLHGNFIGVHPGTLSPYPYRLSGVVSCFNYSKALGIDLAGAGMSGQHNLEPYFHVNMQRCCFDNNYADNYLQQPVHTMSQGSAKTARSYAVPIGGRYHRYVYARGNRPHNATHETNFYLIPGTPSPIRCEKFRAYKAGFTTSMWPNLVGRLQKEAYWTGQYVFDDYVFYDPAGMQEALDFPHYDDAPISQRDFTTQVAFSRFAGLADRYLHRSYSGIVASDNGPNRHTAVGRAWWAELHATDTYMEGSRQGLPAVIGPFVVALFGGEAKRLSVWCKVRDEMEFNGTNSPQARILCRGGQIAGVPDDVECLYTATPGTYQQLSIELQPSMSGVVEIELQVYQTNPYAMGAAWFDDFLEETV